MSIFDGHVLRGPRVSPSNDPKTGAPQGGVDNDIKTLTGCAWDSGSTTPHAPDHGFTQAFRDAWGADNATHPCVDQYRSSILIGNDGELEEYLVFSENTASISSVETGDAEVTDGKASIPRKGNYLCLTDLLTILADSIEDGQNILDNEVAQSYIEKVGGTVSFVHDNTRVTGIGTNFEDQLAEGVELLFKDGDKYYSVTVDTIISVNELELTEPFQVQLDSELEDAEEEFLTIQTDEVQFFKPYTASDRLVLSDNGGRDVSGVKYIKVRRGDVEQEDEFIIELTVAAGDIEMPDPSSGLVFIVDNEINRARFSPWEGHKPGLSTDRGDQVIEVGYYLTAPKFYWTRNDSILRRFSWNGKDQSWKPYKGSAIKNLGVLEEPTVQLTPRPKNLTIGDYLPGTQVPDSVAVVRLGGKPDAGSYALGDSSDPDPYNGFRGILVVPDSILDEDKYDFSRLDPSPIAVIGQNSGNIRWNPGAFALYAGQYIWYASDVYNPDSEGEVGKIKGSDINPLFICPIPSPTERPLLRIGNRQWLDVLFADNDADLSTLTPNEKQVAVSLTTGQVKLSAADITKADMGDVNAPNPDFNALWSGATLYYDGVSMCRVAQPLKAAAKLSSSFEDIGGHSVPLAIPVPGLGISGVRLTQDDSGRTPDLSQDITSRPMLSGVKRTPKGLGDTFVYTPNKNWENLVQKNQEDFEDDKPSSSSVFIEMGTNLNNSQLKFHRKATRNSRFEQPLYFQNTDFTPAFYSPAGKMFSRKDGPYYLHGNEVFRLVLNGQDPVFEWDSSTLTGGFTKEAVAYSAQVISDSINASMISEGWDVLGYYSSYVKNRLCLGCTEDSMSIEVLPGLGGIKDFGGCSALGFNPYWKSTLPVSPDIAGSNMDTNWLPDTGSCMGFKRSPYNKGSGNSTPDFRSRNRIDELFIDTVKASPFVYLRKPPLEDVAGVDEGVFFEVMDGPYRTPLKHMDNILCDFGKGYFRWLDDKVLAFNSKTPVSTISFGYSGVVPESLHPALNGYFFEREPGGEDGFQLQEEGENFIFVRGGDTGTVLLTKQIGEHLWRGSKGEFEEGTSLFTDTSVDSFSTIAGIGDRLKVLTGDSEGSYLISEINDHQLTVYPNFPADSDGVVSYELYGMKSIDEMDTQVVADYVYKRFNHLPYETFEVHVLSPVGVLDDAWQDSPKFASVTRDYARQRDVALRMGLVGKNAAKFLQVRWLKKFELGELQNASLFINNDQFNDNSHTPASLEDTDSWAFQLRVATRVLLPSEFSVVENNLEFSEDPEIIEIALDTGELKFCSSILEQYGQSIVVFEETLKSPEDLDLGTAEVNPDTGEIQISLEDQQDQTTLGETVYWDSRMVTEDQTDVFLNPMVGAFMFREPLEAMQIVEVGYWTTDNAGNRLTDDEGEVLPEVVEFLPLLLRAEECVKIDDNTYSFNPSGRTVRQDIEPIIYVGPEMANSSGSVVRASVDYENNRIKFEFDLPPADEELTRPETYPNSGFYENPDPMSMWDVRGRKVTITYGVIESFGGEVSYTVSLPPVWRPPFNIEGKETSFDLFSDRTGDLHAGQMMRLGAFLFYLKTVTYNAETNITTVEFFPESPSTGAGSRAPGNDVLTLITEFPVARTVDPFDPVAISDTPSGNLYRVHDSSPHGFLVPLSERVVFGKEDTTPMPVVFEPTPKTRNEVIFFKNLMPFLGLGYLMEIGGCPHTVTGLKLSDDGTRTTVSITPPLTQNISYGEQDILVSFRPVYPPGPITYQGLGIPFLDREPTDLVLWGEKDQFGNVLPGRSLAAVQEYNADPQNGDITFQHPYQNYLESDQWLTFRRVQVRILKPRISNGYPELPAFKTRFKHVTSPTEENGLLKNALLGTFTYRAMDSFYYRTIPLEDFSGETATNILKEAAAKSSSYGSSLGGFSENNWDQGRVGIPVEKQHLFDRDRAARSYLEFFNSVVVGFEQIDECATGRIIGDRDGKIKFWVGKGMDYTPKGFENPVTGLLNPNFAYGRAFQAYVPDGLDVIMQEDDLIVNPFNFEVDSNDDLAGEFPDSDLRRVLFDGQSRFVKNDIDDRVMTGYQLNLVGGFPFLSLKISGKVSSMDERHEFSRLFSTKANYFTTTYPGAASDPEIGDFGVYTFYQKIDDKWSSTYLGTIGFVENPVLGNIGNLSDVNMRERYPRARVYAYSATGFPELDDDLFPAGSADSNSFTENPRPAVIASVLPLEDFPLKDGKPDFDLLASNQNAPDASSTPDLNSGAFEEHTPPWGLGMRLQFGHPNGDFVVPKYNETLTMLGDDVFRDVYVGEIIKGCVMTFAYKDDDDDLQVITDGSMIINEADGNASIKLKRSDTLLKMAGDGVISVEEGDLTLGNLNEYTAMLPTYRVGWDVSVIKKTGRIRDISLPSWSDPFIGLMELTAQNPVKPCTRIEGEVEYFSSASTPTFIPALLGEEKNDSGDYTLPYMKATNTELMRLREAQAEIIRILQQDGPAGIADHDWLAVYPDEFLSLSYPTPEGLVLNTGIYPVADEGVYNQGTGIGDIRNGDLMIIETTRNDDEVKGVQGILSIGGSYSDGNTSMLSVPRFVTPTKGEDTVTGNPSDPIFWTVNNLTAVIADFAGNDTGIWTEADGVNPYGSQGIKVIETQVNGPDPLEPWVDGYTETEIVFNSLMFDVDDGAASLADGVDFGSGYNDPDNAIYSTGGLNSILAGAGVDTTLTIKMLKRAEPQIDPDGNFFVQPLNGIDGRVKLQLTLEKIVEGDDYSFMTQDPAIAPHQFKIKSALFPNDAVPGSAQTSVIPENKVWLYTSTEANKPSRMVIRTYHPEDPAQFSDPFPAGHPNEGDPNPASDPDFVDSWFPWTEYTHLDLDDPTDTDGDQVIRVRETSGFDTETESIFAESYEEFLVDLNVYSGSHSHIKEDRLTFYSKFDSRQAYPRFILEDDVPVTPTHPYGNMELPLTLSVDKVTINVHRQSNANPVNWLYTPVRSVVNSPDEVNGGDPFTFLPRATLLDDMADPVQPTLKGVGYWYGGYGELRVMGFEGHNNTPINFNDTTLMASAIPSSDLCSNNLVLTPQNALGSMTSWFDDGSGAAPDTALFPHQISPVLNDFSDLANSGNVSFDCRKVEKGDVVYVSGGVNGSGSPKVGTYLTKYALQPAGAVNTTPDGLEPIRPVKPFSETVPAGINSSLDLSFPTISGVKWLRDPQEFRLYVSGMTYNEDFPTTGKTGFPDTGTVYVFITNPDETMSNDDFGASALSIMYTELNVEDPDNPYFVIDFTTLQDGAGNGLSEWECIYKLFGVDVGNAAEIMDFWDNLDLSTGDYNEEYDDNTVAHPDSLLSLKVSGAKYFSVNIFHPNSTKFPEQRLVGYNWNDDLAVSGPFAGNHALYGFVSVSLTDSSFAGTYVDQHWSADGSLNTLTDFTVEKKTAVTAGEFQENEHATVFDNTPSYIDLSGFGFAAINTNGGVGDLDCLLPTSSIELLFWAETGIFLETNFPKPTFDLSRDFRSIVCDSEGDFEGYNLPPEAVGERDTMDYDTGAITFAFSEHVTFSVRRIRRWHDVLLGLSDAMAALRFAYEIRRGTVDTYTWGHMFHKISLTGEGTQLGALDDEDVNVNAGDMVRVLDPETNELKCWGEISNVLNGNELRIWPPGFIGGTPESGDLVEIYLSKAPVPQEQSNEQLLELMTDQVVLDRPAAMQTPEHGFPASGGVVKWDGSEVSPDEFGVKPKSAIYEASVNWLTDTNAGVDSGMINFEAEGVEIGDYLLIDPAGELVGPTGVADPDTPEYGMRPFGDRGADKTLDKFIAGRPAETDDNRGYYKVVKVEQTRIQVSPNRNGDSEFIGDTGVSSVMNAVHGGLTVDTNEFVLYPTIKSSLLTGDLNPDGFAGEEGQGDLRPTAFGGEDPLNPDTPDTLPNSFKDNPFSVGPFSYKIIRPTRLLNDDTVELILFHRERILSLMENFDTAMKQTKRGNYWEFQLDRHSFDLGIPTIPETGLGVPSNAYLYDLAGHYTVSPFLNDSDALSILDRRVILEDILLDREQPPFSDPTDPFYTKFSEEDGLPLLLGRIDQALNKSDRIRQKRLAWLYLRTTKTDGTLASIRNWDALLKERMAERERLRRLQESTGG